MAGARSPLIPVLHGGRAARFHILDYGLFNVHGDGRVIGLCGYLIKTDHGHSILIDTGMPAKYVSKGKAAAREDGLDAFGSADFPRAPTVIAAAGRSQATIEIADFRTML